MSTIPYSTIYKIASRVVEDLRTGCWEWQGARSKGGYGNIRVGDRTMGVHRVAYEAAEGPIPDGLTLDHLCRNRKCCNPDHLEPVPQAENSHRTRRSHCSRGHPKTADNLVVSPKTGHRKCKKCHAIRARKSRAQTVQEMFA